MKFADYFKGAITYGESLGLRNGTKEAYADFCVELDEPRTLERDDGPNFYPSFLVAWSKTGIRVDSLDPFKPEFDVSQQVKLLSMFISAYEKYLADKKEPVAADSAE